MRPYSGRFGVIAVAAAASVLVFAYGARARAALGRLPEHLHRRQLPFGGRQARFQRDVEWPKWPWRRRRRGRGRWRGRSTATDEGNIQAVITSRRCAPNETPCDQQRTRQWTASLQDDLGLTATYKPEFWIRFRTWIRTPTLRIRSSFASPTACRASGHQSRLCRTAKRSFSLPSGRSWNTT